MMMHRDHCTRTCILTNHRNASSKSEHSSGAPHSTRQQRGFIMHVRCAHHYRHSIYNVHDIHIRMSIVTSGHHAFQHRQIGSRDQCMVRVSGTNMHAACACPHRHHVLFALMRTIWTAFAQREKMLQHFFVASTHPDAQHFRRQIRHDCLLVRAEEQHRSSILRGVGNWLQDHHHCQEGIHCLRGF